MLAIIKVWIIFCSYRFDNLDLEDGSSAWHVIPKLEIMKKLLE